MTRSTTLCTSLALAVALAGCGGSEPAGETTDTASPVASAAGPALADVDFAQMMVPHHAQAVQMSELLLAKDGVDAEVRELAGQIRAAQQPEIDQMVGWLRSWRQPIPPTAGPEAEAIDHGGHGGMMSRAELQALEDADGARAATLFLEQMIRHHEGAVAMARDQIADGTFPPAVDLARAVESTQQAEIAAMRELLASG